MTTGFGYYSKLSSFQWQLRGRWPPAVGNGADDGLLVLMAVPPDIEAYHPSRFTSRRSPMDQADTDGISRQPNSIPKDRSVSYVP